MKKAILWFLTAIIMVSAPAAQAAYVQTGQVCTPVYTWVQPCILPPPAPPVCPPPAPPVVKCPPIKTPVCPAPPKKQKDTCLQKKLNAIRREALKQFKCLEKKLKGVGWVKVVAERDRWKSGRYVISITLARSDDRNYQITIYQVTELVGKCEYQTFYVWDYDCSSSDYEPDDYIGSRKELLEMLKDY